MSTSVEGNWRGHYQFYGGQAQPSEKVSFKAKFKTKNNSFSGSCVERKFFVATIKGQVQDSTVSFESRIKTTSPPSYYEGTIGSDGTMYGTCKIERNSQHYIGTWFAERYQPNALESFFEVERVIGIVFILVGLGVGYFGIWSPIEVARQHTQERVTIYPELEAVVAAFIPIGLAALVFGHGGNEFLERHLLGEKKTIKGWIIFGAFLGLMGLLYFWVKSQLAMYGYR